MPSENALTVPIRVNPGGFEVTTFVFCSKNVEFEFYEWINALRHFLSMLTHSIFLMPPVNALTVPIRVNPGDFEGNNLCFLFKNSEM